MFFLYNIDVIDDGEFFMKYEKYYIESSNGYSNCVIRSFCKLYNYLYDDVYEKLLKLTQELKANNYNDIVVFETFMERHNTFKIESPKIKIKDLNLDNGKYIVFCYDKKDFYHMIPIINNTIYDKNKDCLELYVIDIYKKV